MTATSLHKLARSAARLMPIEPPLPGTVGHLIWPLQLYGHNPDEWWLEDGAEMMAEWFDRFDASDAFIY